MNTVLRSIPAALALSAAGLTAQTASAAIIADTNYQIELGYVDAAGSVVKTGSGSVSVGQALREGLFDVSDISLTWGTCPSGTTSGCGVFSPTPPPVNTKVYLAFNFKLVAVKTISWSHDDESPKETVTFEYGGLQIPYTIQSDPIRFAGATASSYKGWTIRVSGLGVDPAADPPWDDCLVNPARCGQYSVLDASGNVVGTGLLGVLANPVPEPSSAWLLLGGLGALAFGFRRRPTDAPAQTRVT